MNHFRNDLIHIRKTKTVIHHSTFQTTTQLTLPTNTNKLNREKTSQRIKILIRIRETRRRKFRSNPKPNLQLIQNILPLKIILFLLHKISLITIFQT